MTRLQSGTIYLSFLFCSLLAPTNARAGEEPYLSVRTGLRCSQCHTNRTGGGGRTAFGIMYAQTMLGMRKFEFRNRLLNDFVAVGGNLRVLASGTPTETTPRTTIGLHEATVQVEVRVVSDVLAFYVDQTLGPTNASNREAFALLERLPLNGYLKVGKFLLPYGWRLVDDAEYIRQRTGFTYQTPDQGVEVGIEPGPLSLFVSLTNGTQGADENNNGKQVTATAAIVLPRFTLGASASRNDGLTGRRDVVGAFGGFNLGRFAVLGEADLIIDSAVERTDKEQLVGFVEGDFLAVPGLNLKVTYGYLDRDRTVAQDAKTRLRLGIEAFPIQFLQISGFYTLLQDIPQATTDLDRISLEFHVYF